MESRNQTSFEVAEVKLSYTSKVKPSMRPKITQSKDCEMILRSFWKEEKLELVEEFKILLLNRGNKVLGILDVSQGGISGVTTDPKIIFVAALKGAATGIILAHNHPSGNLNPSQADIDLTRKCKEAARFLDMKVLDHIIITSEAYYSFADEGLL